MFFYQGYTYFGTAMLLCVWPGDRARACRCCCFGDRKLLASLQYFYFFLGFVCSFGRIPTCEVTQSFRLSLLRVSCLGFTHLYLQITTTWQFALSSFKNGSSAKMKLVAKKMGLS